MKIFVKGQGAVTLHKRHFVAKGGEGDVYVVGDVAYKLFHDPQKAIPASKIRELAAIADDRVIRPEATVLRGPSGPTIGYAMPFVRDAEPLCRLFPRAFKERHGLDAAALYAIVEDLAARVRSVHAAGALVVDLNEMNFLVQMSTRAVFAIDADSYQTKSHPATAIMPAIRDPRTEHAPFDELSDWFSFAVLSFQLMVGVHPYKGKHKDVKGLAQRMLQGLSVLGPDVTLPPVASSLDVIPGNWRAWYQAVLEDQKRLPPPEAMSGAPVVARLAAMSSQAELDTELLLELEHAILALLTGDGELIAVTEDGVFVGRKKVHGPVGGAGGSAGTSCSQGGAQVALATTPRGRPVAVWCEAGSLVVIDVLGGVRLATAMGADEITTSGGRILVRQGDNIAEVVLLDVGTTVIASLRIVAHVLPHATRLFDGGAVQSLLGATFVSLFPAALMHLQLRVPELDGLHMLEARAHGDLRRGLVLMAVCRDARGDDVRLTFRIAPDGKSYDVSRRSLALPMGAALAVLDTGLCVALLDDGSLEAFPAAVGATARRDIRADLSGNVHLDEHHGQLVCARDNRVYRLASHGHTTSQTSRSGHPSTQRRQAV